MATRTESTRKRQQHWQQHIEAADASRGTLVSYAAAHDLNAKDLYRWKTVLARRGVLPAKVRKPAFVAVANRPASTTPTNCSITLPNGVQLQVAGNLDAAMLTQLLAAAHGLS